MVNSFSGTILIFTVLGPHPRYSYRTVGGSAGQQVSNPPPRSTRPMGVHVRTSTPVTPQRKEATSNTTKVQLTSTASGSSSNVVVVSVVNKKSL